jgi:hypothetical protein
MVRLSRDDFERAEETEGKQMESDQAFEQIPSSPNSEEHANGG